jgi:putative transcriptional regulator
MFETEQDALAPGLLIAMPQLTDPNFEGSVILMLEHNEEGSFGIVVNNPVEAAITLHSEKGEDVPVIENVFLGGPVAPHVCMVLHSSEWSGERSQALIDGLYMSEPSHAVPQLLERTDVSFRFIMGYSGWGPGQLAGELAHGAWLCSPVTADLVLNTVPEDQWSIVIKNLGIDPLMLVPAGTTQ